MQGCLQDKDSRYPSVEEQVSRMRPVGRPKQDVIAAGEENY